jgi:sortase A
MIRRHTSAWPARLLLILERTLLVLGCVSAGLYRGSIAQSNLSQAEAGRLFDRLILEKRAPATAPGLPFSPGDVEAEFVNTDEWSPSKIRTHQSRFVLQLPPPLARLQIPSLGLSAIVLEGTDETSLIQGVGHIEGTARPGEAGNVGLAGHRDSFFRSLSRIVIHDEIILTTLEGRDLSYTVASIDIVEPETVEVLAPTETPSVTLVTCYSFYFLGSALRYVVRATLQEDQSAEVVTSGTPDSVQQGVTPTESGVAVTVVGTDTSAQVSPLPQ